ncbi:hypothetical protein ACT4MK_36820 [Bradyrhizobium barranii]|uniref:hypothetical protein n=1 Tax=Bradyrhizobium TaxID=374 RepID=UPI003F1F49A2
MIVRVDIPEITNYPDGFPSHWMNIIFLGNRPDAYKVHAIVTTYVRLVEGALVHYRQARGQVLKLWNTHTAIAIGSHNLASTYFEDCINSMHRATLCMNRMRGNRDVPDDLKALFRKRPRFAADTVAKRLRDTRDTIQHMDEKVFNAEIPDGTPFMLLATGLETPVLDSDQPNQTLKVIDRLIIGDQEISFVELATWLTEMGECAEVISKYERPK